MSRAAIAGGSRFRNIGFKISGGQIIGIDNNPFFAKGINFPYAAGATEANQVLTLFPGINFVRLAEGSYTNVSGLTPFVTTLTNAHVVVEIEDHTSGAPPTGTALTTQQNWYSAIATAFKNNPYVWFGSLNEPNPETNITTNQVQTYNTIRAAGARNPIMFCEWWGGWIGGIGDPPLTTASYASMTNIIWDVHFYSDFTSSTNQTTVNTILRDDAVGAAQTIPSADGVVPVIIGEFGPSAMATPGVDTNFPQILQAVTQYGPLNGYTSGFVGWYFGTDPADGNSLTLDGVTHTTWGNQMAAAIVA